MITQTKPGYVSRMLSLRPFVVEWLAYLARNPRRFESQKSGYNRLAMEALMKCGYVTEREESTVFGKLYWYSITRDGVMAALANRLTINPDLRHWMQEPE